MATNTVRTPAEVATAAIQAIAAGQLDALDELGVPELVDDFVAIGRFEGREAVKGFLEELRAAFRTSRSASSASSPTTKLPWCSRRPPVPSGVRSRALSPPGDASSFESSK